MGTRSSLVGGTFYAANQVLGALSENAFAQLAPHLHKVAFKKGASLWSPSSPSGSIFFPLSGLISIVRMDTEGRGIEVGFAGRESAVGFSTDELTRGTVQVAGISLQVLKDRFWALASEHAELRTLAACCQDWMLVQSRVLAACNAVHDVQARLCRWMLQISDRTGAEIPSTQDEIAQLLGVRRTTLTLVAHKLQDDQAIRYRRGLIMVQDRAHLRTLTCDCYHDMAALPLPCERMEGLALHQHAAAELIEASGHDAGVGRHILGTKNTSS